MNLKIILSDKFTDKLESFSKNLQDFIIGKIKKLETNPGYPSLRTKKVQGQTNLFESSVNMDIRIFWEYDDNSIIINDIGYHDILKKY